MTPDKVKTDRVANVCLNCLRSFHRVSTYRNSGCQKYNKLLNSKLRLKEEEQEEAYSNNLIIDQLIPSEEADIQIVGQTVVLHKHK